ncbi:Flavonoid 3'5'-hydroxylase [Musa troglodytarum]|uniref:Flavonoid 3'5'-hydroxylase n=2 Tax=Musa troglodytarum TaxID=320322 RepID=A0A9E7EMY7_9LILI|nr:Flavonoid 3'5'-hydroxylase [Musa troglodytarum]
MLGNKALESWAAVQRNEVDRMSRSIHASGRGRKGEPVMLGGMLIYAMANMIGRVILSRRVFETKGSEANEFKAMVVELMTLAAQVNIGDFLPAVAWMDLQGLEARMKKLHKKFDRVLSRMVLEHEASKGEPEGRPDLLDAVMAIRDGPEEEKLTDDNVKALLWNLFAAGTDTSKGTMEWAMAEMLLNPCVLRRAPGRDGRSHRPKPASGGIRHTKAPVPSSHMQGIIPEAPIHASQPPTDLNPGVRGQWLLHPEEHEALGEHMGHREGPGRVGAPTRVQPRPLHDDEGRQDRPSWQ